MLPRADEGSVGQRSIFVFIFIFNLTEMGLYVLTFEGFMNVFWPD